MLKRQGWNAVATCTWKFALALKSYSFQMCALLRYPNALSWRDSGSNRINLLESPKWFKVTLEHFSSIILRRCNRQNQLSDSLLRRAEPNTRCNGIKPCLSQAASESVATHVADGIRTVSPGCWYMLPMVIRGLFIPGNASFRLASVTFPILVYLNNRTRDNNCPNLYSLTG